MIRFDLPRWCKYDPVSRTPAGSHFGSIKSILPVNVDPSIFTIFRIIRQFSMVHDGGAALPGRILLRQAPGELRQTIPTHLPENI